MYRKQILLLTAITIAISSYSFGQKVKYKDLFYLLNAKKYNDAEPFLKIFLNNPKKADHPNANFQMAFIYNEKYKSKDMLTATEDKLFYLDSAIHYFNLAKSLITEKEIKRNDEYYEDYYRRDLRTGKMGIKISDIQLDIETRIAGLSKNKNHIILIKEFFSKSEDFYSKAQSEYRTMIEKFDSQKQFYLRSDESLIGQLRQIKNDYDSSMGNFGKYKMELIKMESPIYDQRLDVKQVVDIKKDGTLEADFFKNSIEVWNYDFWAKMVIDIIEKEIIPMQNKLVTYDEELDKLYRKVKEDSLSVISDLLNREDDLLESHIHSYDDDPFPLVLFALKQAELAYLSERLENRKFIDSVHVDQQLALTTNSLKLIDEIGTLINNHVSSYDLEEESLNYKPLVNERFGDVNGLKKFIQDKSNLVSQSKLELENELKTLIEKSKWLIFKSDSIPLFERDTSDIITLKKDNSYIYYGKQEVNDSLRFTYGLNYDFTGVPSVYYASITPSHQTDTLNKYSIDSTAFALDSLQNVRMMNISDNNGGTYVLVYSANYFDMSMESHLFKVKNDLTLGWERSITLLYPPDVLTISNDFGVLAINYNVKYIDKSKGLQLISRVLYDMQSGEAIKEKK